MVGRWVDWQVGSFALPYVLDVKFAGMQEEGKLVIRVPEKFLLNPTP